MQLKSRRHQHGKRHAAEHPYLCGLQQTPGELAPCGPGIQGVDLGVEQPVESHSEATSRDHSDGDPKEPPKPGDALFRKKRTGVGKGKGKDAVFELNQPGEKAQIVQRRRPESANARKA